MVASRAVVVAMGLFVVLGYSDAQASCGWRDRPADYLQQTRDDDYYVLSLEVGRVHIMVNQIALILGRTEEVVELQGVLSTGALLADLELTVSRFNRLLPAACKLVKAATMDCAVYRPTWSVTDMPSLLIALDEVYAHVMPLWKAVCSKNKQHCIME